MNNAKGLSLCVRRVVFSAGCCLLLATGLAARTHAADYQNLPVVKPVMTCDQLGKADVSKAVGATVTIQTAAIRETDKGPYCRLVGIIDPEIGFAADLPIEHWTQRYIQGAQTREGISRAGGCMPALNGEFAVATKTGSQFPTTPGSPWGMTAQQRVVSAYLGHHLTSVTVKALIKTFYGQPVKFSYMIGCSGGGGETLMNAQRYPEDFDGYSIGAPPIYDTVHNLAFWHGWEYHANQRADGSIILQANKLPVLHAAVIEHCGAVSGLMDNELQQPTLCNFDKSWVQCKPGAADTSNCLTAEEANVAEQLYLGPNDGKNFFEMSGFPLGSEMTWKPSSPGKPSDTGGQTANGFHRLLMPPLSGESTQELAAQFAFTQDWWDKALEMAPLFNVGNTNLRPLAATGHKIILWNGAEDSTVEPAGTIHYYQSVQKEMGEKLTDSVIRFFLLPGVGHCGNGDGANQVDILTPLMAWVEMKKAPMVIVAGKPVPATGGGRGGGAQAAAAPGAPPAYPPYETPDRATIYTRPEYPFPNVAKYKGTGDPNDAANYEEVKGPMTKPQVFTNEAAKLVGPNNQKFYKVVNDQLVESPKE